MEEELVEILTKKQYKITTAESCTGGLVAATIVNVSGASEVFQAGFVTYANEAKEKELGVKSETLQTYGAVSEKTAKEMAIGCAAHAKAQVGISTTGIAGPGGGTASRQRQSRFTSGTNCDTGRPESAPSCENRLPNPPARTLRTNRSRSRFYFLSLAVKTTSLSAAGQERCGRPENCDPAWTI